MLYCRGVPIAYTILRPIFERAAAYFFLDIEVIGAENIPSDGPVLFASNHPNSLMDTVVLGAHVQRPIHFLARSGLFSNPAAGAVLRAAGAIPIYRRQDGNAGPGSNRDAFSAAYEVLKGGGIIGIFPEGQNAPSRHVRDIKTGIARIALGAEASAREPVGVKVVPVGLNYEKRHEFLSRVLIRFGTPIDARSHFEAHGDDRDSVVALTREIESQMRELAVHVHKEERIELLESIDELVGEEVLEEKIGKVDVRSVDRRLLRKLRGRGGKDPQLNDRFQVRQWIADAIEYFDTHDPGRVARLERNLDRYRLNLAQLHLKEDFGDRAPQTLSARRESMRLLLYAMILAPIALWGLVHNFVPYRLTRRAAIRAPEEAIIAVRGLSFGFLYFGLTYAIVGGMAYGALRWWPGVAMWILSLPVAGAWFLRYRRRLGIFAHRIFVRGLFGKARRLLERAQIQREQLHIEIQAMRRLYESEVEPRDAPPR